MGLMQKRLIIVITLACGILAYSFYSFVQKSPEHQELNRVEPRSGNIEQTSPAVTNGAGNEVVVYVSGGVSKPGVYKLSHGSRVVDAVTLAGGFAPGSDAAKINLAMLLKDEMQINVPYAVPAASTNPGIPTTTGNSSNSGDKISINTANQADFDKLPGIGPALAERIVEYRTANGPFRDVADIKKVPGIGEAKYNNFKNKISL